ncbi:potassium channel family protein [Microbacterium deminutum]|uniref:Potassium channel family protein n=2 Tax=Microbacterium deminutum TaxID=344164 RepID=A0ABN2RKT1_9MICO
MEWPLMAAAVVFLIAYATQILAREKGAMSGVAEVVVWVMWAVFAIDYIVRLAITEKRGKWFLRHLLDLAIVIMPMLRPLRLMRFLTILAIIQRGAGSMLRGRVVVYTVGATALTIVIAGLAVLDAEQGQRGPIQNLGDAIWWAFTTITTVGYGDYFPVTITGRIVAVALMIGGIALIGVVTATLASWIIEKVSLEVKVSTATEEQVEQLRAEIAEMKAMLRALQRAAPVPETAMAAVESGAPEPHR